jgi:hypothetical protein
MAQQPGIIEYGKELAREIADFIFTNSQENLVDSGAIDTSNLFLSGTIFDQVDGTVIQYDANYAEPLDQGTDPHFVSPQELEGWVRRKINPGSDKKVKSIAFAISQAIKKRGTIPNPFFTRAITLAQAKWNIKVEDLN